MVFQKNINRNKADSVIITSDKIEFKANTLKGKMRVISYSLKGQFTKKIKQSSTMVPSRNRELFHIKSHSL